MAHVLWHILMVFIAFLLASTTSGLVFKHIITHPNFLILLHPDSTWDSSKLRYFAAMVAIRLIYSSVAIAFYGFIPTVIAAFVAEYFAVRSILAYLAASLLIFSICGILSDQLVYWIGAGLVFGFVFWLLAGRKAGLRKPETP
ncbi:MAG: hypothetical protein WCB71_07155 [Aestuariivirga sp.]